MKRSEIIFIKNTQTFHDPFPEESLAQSIELERLNRIFPRLFKFRKVGALRISIWKAYRIGYDKAYEEILSHCED